MSWQPQGKDLDMVVGVFCMVRDTYCANGVADRETFISNLRLFADAMEGRSGEPGLGDRVPIPGLGVCLLESRDNSADKFARVVVRRWTFVREDRADG